MGETQMTNCLNEFINRGNVVIFKNGIPAQLGSYDFEADRYHNGNRYNIYVGARGTWINWAMISLPKIVVECYY
jgi:hypothetical protein